MVDSEIVDHSQDPNGYVKNPLVAKWCLKRFLASYHPLEYPDEAKGTVRQRANQAGICYDRFMNAYEKTRCVKRKRTRLTLSAFWTSYRGEHPDHYRITPKKLSVLDRQYFLDEECTAANFAVYSGKLPRSYVNDPSLWKSSLIPTLVRSKSALRKAAARKRKYDPQSGTMPLTCFNTASVFASTCMVSLLNSTASKCVFVNEHLGRVFIRLEQEHDFVYIVFVLAIVYCMCHMAVDCLRGMKWLYWHYVVPSYGHYQQRWYGCSPKYQPQSGLINSSHIDHAKTAARMFSLVGTVLGGIVSIVTILLPTAPKLDTKPDYGPQSGMSSDDGDLFTGRASPAKKKIDTSTRPASASAPGMQAIPTRGGVPLPRVPPPRPKKDPNDGVLNGFGIGI